VSQANSIGSERTRRYTEDFTAHYSALFSAVHSRIGNFQEAEDICQEVFLRLYRKYDEVENTRRWLYGALRIVMLDYYKQRGRADVDVDAILDDTSLAYVNGFRDTRLLLQEAMEAIYADEGEREWILFNLIAIHGFSLVQAGRHLKISYKQVRYGYEKAVKTLLAHLNARGIRSLEDLL